MKEPARSILLGLVLVAAAVAVYYPVHHHPYFYPDDGLYVADNHHIQLWLGWETVRWGLLQQYPYWHPLTWLSHFVDYQSFGADPAGHHDMNIAFHALDALVLFWVLRRATGFVGRSFVVAALFAVHPINVEPVGWIAERKTLLCFLDILLTLGVYRWYARKPGVIRYGVVAGLFVVGLMCKPQAIILPLVLLLWDYWPLGRMFALPETPIPSRSFKWLVLEKVPLLAVCVVEALVVMKSQGVLNPNAWQYTLAIRVENAIVSYARYIGKAFWPFGLAPTYPHPGNSLRAWQVLAALGFLLAITGLVAAAWRRRYLTAGWLWFLVTLVPMIGIVQVGDQGMADRYGYVSFVGLYVMFCWSVADWFAGVTRVSPADVAARSGASQARFAAWLLPSASAVGLSVLAIIAHRQVGYWSDDMTIWSHTLEVTSNNWVAESRVGGQLLLRGRPEEAAPYFFRAEAIYPSDPSINLQVGLFEQQRGNLPAAIDHWKEALRFADYSSFGIRFSALLNLSRAYTDLGDASQAEHYSTEAQQVKVQALAQP